MNLNYAKVIINLNNRYDKCVYFQKIRRNRLQFNFYKPKCYMFVNKLQYLKFEQRHQMTYFLKVGSKKNQLLKKMSFIPFILISVILSQIRIGIDFRYRYWENIKVFTKIFTRCYSMLPVPCITGVSSTIMTKAY